MLNFFRKFSNKLLFSVFLLFIICFSIFHSVGKDYNKKYILVSVLPIKGILENLLGDKSKYYEINAIINTGVDHHHIDLSPVLIKKIDLANYILEFGGLELEKMLLTKASKTKVINLYDGFYDLNDPHVWLSLKNLKKIYINTYNFIYSIDKVNYKYYKNRLNLILSSIELYDKQIKDKLIKYKGKYVLSYHNEYSYFAKDYGIDIIYYSYNESEPSLKDIEKIIDLMKKDKIAFILTASYYDNTVFDKIFQKSNKKVKIIVLDPFNKDTIEVFKKIYLNL